MRGGGAAQQAVHAVGVVRVDLAAVRSLGFEAEILAVHLVTHMEDLVEQRACLDPIDSEIVVEALAEVAAGSRLPGRGC